MSEVIFTTQQLPNGKWRLTKSGVDMGVYNTREEAEAAMGRIINRVIFQYDEKGLRIT